MKKLFFLISLLFVSQQIMAMNGTQDKDSNNKLFVENYTDLRFQLIIQGNDGRVERWLPALPATDDAETCVRTAFTLKDGLYDIRVLREEPGFFSSTVKLFPSRSLVKVDEQTDVDAALKAAIGKHSQAHEINWNRKIEASNVGIQLKSHLQSLYIIASLKQVALRSDTDASLKKAVAATVAAATASAPAQTAATNS